MFTSPAHRSRWQNDSIAPQAIGIPYGVPFCLATSRNFPTGGFYILFKHVLHIICLKLLSQIQPIPGVWSYICIVYRREANLDKTLLLFNRICPYGQNLKRIAKVRLLRIF